MTQGIHGYSSPRADVFPAGLRVLVVDDDPTWLKILEKMLKKCSYEGTILVVDDDLTVTTCGLAIEALDRLRERKDGFEIVISDVNMPDMDGFKLLEHVGLEMDLPVIMMSVDGETSRVMRGVQHGACDYLLKPIRMKELRNIWQHVYRKKIHEVRDTESHEGLEEILMMKNVSDQSDDMHFLCGDMTPGKKRKDVEHKYDENDFGENSSAKKARVVWTVELHQKFVKAVNFIGFEKVGPKKILDLMNVPWLTRENVASHLQKYRLYLTRLQKDDLKTSSSGLKHPEFPPIDESIQIQQNEAVNSYLTNANTSSLQTIEPQKVLTGYAACFGSVQYSTFNPELLTQYSWNRGFTEIEFKQEPNKQFQVQNGFINLGLPTQQFRKKKEKPAKSSGSYSVISQNLKPSFQPPDPNTISNDHQSLLQTSLNNMELSAFLLQGQRCSSTNLVMQNKGVSECNDQEFIPEVPSNLYDALIFDYAYPLDSLEYPVIDQGLFIV